MANGAQQQGLPSVASRRGTWDTWQRQIGEVLTDDNGDSFTWTRLPDGTEDWKLTALLQVGDVSAAEPPQDAVADEEDGWVPDWLSGAAGVVKRNAPGLARSAAQGATFGFSDEIGGAVRGAVTPGMSWREGIEKEREALADVPLPLRIPGEIAGGLLTGGALVRGATALPGVGRAIGTGMRGQGRVLPRVLGTKRAEQAARGLATGAVGAAEGALYGAGQGEGSPFDAGRWKGAGQGAGWGGGIGTVLPFIPGIGRLTAPLSGAGPRTLRTGEAIQEGLEGAVPPGIAAPPTPTPMRSTLPDVAAMTPTGAASPVSRRVLGEGSGQTGGLLQALQDRGAEQARVLREGVQEVRDKFYKPLDAKFQRGWDTEIVGDLSRDAREANVELVRLLRDDVLGSDDLGSALRGRPLSNTPHVDPDVIRNLGNVIKSSGRGGEDYADLVEMLGHEEISMLRRNLRSLADNRVPDARIAMDKVDNLMETMFGPEVTRANREFAKASQLKNAGMAGRTQEGVKALTTHPDYAPLFAQNKLRTAGGMREAVAALPNILGREIDPAHVAAVERQLKMGRWHQAMSKPTEKELHTFMRSDEGVAWVKELFKNEGAYTDAARKGLDNALLAIKNNAPNMLDNIATQLYRHAGWVVAAAALAPVASGLLGGNDNR